MRIRVVIAETVTLCVSSSKLPAGILSCLIDPFRESGIEKMCSDGERIKLVHSLPSVANHTLVREERLSLPFTHGAIYFESCILRITAPRMTLVR